MLTKMNPLPKQLIFDLRTQLIFNSRNKLLAIEGLQTTPARNSDQS